MQWSLTMFCVEFWCWATAYLWFPNLVVQTIKFFFFFFLFKAFAWGFSLDHFGLKPGNLCYMNRWWPSLWYLPLLHQYLPQLLLWLHGVGWGGGSLWRWEKSLGLLAGVEMDCCHTTASLKSGLKDCDEGDNPNRQSCEWYPCLSISYGRRGGLR